MFFQIILNYLYLLNKIPPFLYFIINQFTFEKFFYTNTENVFLIRQPMKQAFGLDMAIYKLSQTQPLIENSSNYFLTQYIIEFFLPIINFLNNVLLSEVMVFNGTTILYIILNFIVLLKILFQKLIKKNHNIDSYISFTEQCLNNIRILFIYQLINYQMILYYCPRLCKTEYLSLELLKICVTFIIFLFFVFSKAHAQSFIYFIKLNLHITSLLKYKIIKTADINKMVSYYENKLVQIIFYKKLRHLILNFALLSIYLVLAPTVTIPMIYLSLELFGISCALLITISQKSSSINYKAQSDNLLTTVQYLIFSMIGSIIFLSTILYIYAWFGVLDWDKIQVLHNLETFVSRTYIFKDIAELPFKIYFDSWFILFLIILSLLFKGGLFPFHFWALKVYSRLTYDLFFFILIFSKILIISILLKFFLLFNQTLVLYKNWILYIGIANILIGSFLALNNHHIKKFLISSSITNFGYFLMILTFIPELNETNLINYFCLYLFSYFILLLSLYILFIYIGFLETNIWGRQKKNFIPHELIDDLPIDLLELRLDNMENLSQLKHLPKSCKIYLVVISLGLMGFPFFPTFWLKIIILYKFVGSTILYYIMISVYLLNVMSAAYYLNVIYSISFLTDYYIDYINKQRSSLGPIDKIHNFLKNFDLDKTIPSNRLLYYIWYINRYPKKSSEKRLIETYFYCKLNLQKRLALSLILSTIFIFLFIFIIN